MEHILEDIVTELESAYEEIFDLKSLLIGYQQDVYILRDRLNKQTIENQQLADELARVSNLLAMKGN